MFSITRYFFSLIIVIVTPAHANPSENLTQPVENMEQILLVPTPLVAGQIFRDSLQDGGLGPEMVVIPAGAFRMGNLLGKKPF